jgi:signal transduction histidine kinase
VIGRLRTSFAAKLVALEVGTIIVAVVALAAFLITARLAQTRELERNVARTNVDGLRRELDDAGANATTVTRRLAGFAPLVALYDASDQSRLTLTIEGEAATLSSEQTLVALDATGHVVVARRGSASGSVPATVSASVYDHLPVIDQLNSGQAYAHGYIGMVGGRLELDGLSPVKRGNTTIGYIADSVDLNQLLHRVSPAGNSVQYSIFFDGTRAATTFSGRLDPGLPPAITQGGAQTESFAVYQLGGHTYAGYYGGASGQGEHVQLAADVDDSIFAAQNVNDILVVVFTTTLLGTVLSLLAVFFARRYAVGPLAALGEGAARVESGDYSARVHVTTQDDFARLAASFNSMAEKIRENTSQLEDQRARLDAALASLSAVSRALTTTTSGQASLRDAVLEAMAEISGTPAVAMFSGVDRLTPSATRGISPADARALASAESVRVALEQGGGVGMVRPAPEGMVGWHAAIAPMTYQGKRAGALVAFSQGALDEIDLPGLTVLANQAIVALRNAELFERERETVARLQELDSMKSDFLATIQHELRTPLTAIIGMTDLMDMAWSDWKDKQKLDALSDVQLAAKGLYDLVETILDYALMESDKLRLNLEPVGLRDAASAAVDELESVIRKSGVTVNVDVPARLVARADSRRLSQLARALIDNAIKFSPEGARVQVSAGSEDGMVYLTVLDKGIGIDPAHQPRIFERFYQVDNTATRRFGGTGMGLALVERLVKMHKGRIKVDSAPGQGSTFTVYLPSDRAER